MIPLNQPVRTEDMSGKVIYIAIGDDECCDMYLVQCRYSNRIDMYPLWSLEVIIPYRLLTCVEIHDGPLYITFTLADGSFYAHETDAYYLCIAEAIRNKWREAKAK